MRFRIVGRILAAQALSSLGTSMSTVALAVMVYGLTGSVMHMGGIMAASVIPLVVTAWVGGALLDRYSARNIMIGSDFVRAALIFAMPFLAGQSVGLVYMLAALMGIFSGLFNPGQIKLVSEIVEREHLVKANSYLSVARDGAELVGYLAGGVVAAVPYLIIMGIEVTGYTLAFSIDAVSYILSGLFLIGLPRGLTLAGEGFRLRDLLAGSPGVLARLWRRPALRTNLLLAVFAQGALMMNVPNSYVLAQSLFGRGAMGVATLEVFVAAGLIAGGLVVSRMRLSGDKNGYVMFSLAFMAVCFVAVGFSDDFWLSVALMGVAGMGNVVLVVASITMFQETPQSPEKGRLIAMRSGFGQLGIAFGFAFGGFVGEGVGVKPSFWYAGGAAVALGLALYVPYRLGASRRRRLAWNAATQAGARRSVAREVAQVAAFSGVAATSGGLSGPGGGGVAWTAVEAAEQAAVDERAAAGPVPCDSDGAAPAGGVALEITGSET